MGYGDETVRLIFEVKVETEHSRFDDGDYLGDE